LSIWINGRLSGKADTIVYNAQVSREQHAAHGFHDDRACVIDNGFDLERFRPDPTSRQEWRSRLALPGRDALIVGNVGRYNPQKDHATMVRAFSEAVAVDPRLVLVLAGDGLVESNDALARQIAAAGMTSRVRLLGPVLDVHRLYPAFDCFLLSSSFGEAFPNVLGEAMACGVPCITTRIGDSARIVGELGRVTEPGDVGGLASAILDTVARLKDDPGGPALACRERISESYALEVIAQRYADLYASLCNHVQPDGSVRHDPCVN
jgi:glycosyltransferase involved in cell wall biosynthesis